MRIDRMRINIRRRTLIIYTLLFSSCSLPGRTGEKIYSDFFGDQVGNCLQVVNSRDARALDDCCVWVHFKTCPKDIARILSQVPYTKEGMNKKSMDREYPDPSTIDESLISSEPPKWWIIKNLGDSCVKYQYHEPDKDYIRIAYISIDSTDVFYHDISW
jgi:hypothetical protein